MSRFLDCGTPVLYTGRARKGVPMKLLRSVSMLAVLAALLVAAPQAGAGDYGHEEEPVTGCVATGSEYEDPCRGEEPKPEPEPEAGESCDEEATVSLGRDKGDELEDGCLPQFVRRFITRVWKFVGEVDHYADGELSMTLGKVLNLPRRFRSQDDELLDQDTTVLVSNRVRVFRGGERVSRDELDTANDVRVHGKLLRPRMWRVDDDGSAVPTIRAKKVYITG
jgi:hypothetical protein